MSSVPVEQLREAYRQWHDTKGGSVETWFELLDDDVSMGATGGGTPEMPFAKVNRGKSDARQYFEGLAKDWEMISFEPSDYIVDGDRVVVLSRCSFRFRATGKVAVSSKADFLRFKNGKIVEFFEYFDTAAAFAATRPD